MIHANFFKGASRLLLFVFSITLFLYFPATCQSTINGFVADRETKEPLAFVSIFNKKLGIGGTSNIHGKFVIKIPDSESSLSFIFSHIGYKSSTVDISANHVDEIVVELSQDITTLSEVVVTPQKANVIVDKALDRIKENYNTDQYMVVGFQRETVKADDDYIQLLEADFTTGFKQGQTESFLIDGRYAEDKVVRKRDLLWNDKRGGFYTFGLTELGGVSSPAEETFLGLPLVGKNNFREYYDFECKGVVNYDDNQLYVVEFDQKPGSKKSLIKGTLYIDNESYAIIKIKYSLSPKGIKYLKTNRSWDGKELTKSKLVKKVDILSDSYEMTYSKYKDKWYLNTIVRDIGFEVSVNLPLKKGPTKTLNLHSERVISNIFISEIPPLSIKKVPYQLYYFQVHLKNNYENYNPGDWDGYKSIQSDTSYASIVEEFKLSNSADNNIK